MLMAAVIFISFPAMIALIRGHPDRKTIYRLSPLTIASFVLWFALVVWAASDKRNDATISRYVAKMRSSNQFGFVIGSLVVLGIIGAILAV
jgi:hypothetical protein